MDYFHCHRVKKKCTFPPLQNSCSECLENNIICIPHQSHQGWRIDLTPRVDPDHNITPTDSRDSCTQTDPDKWSGHSQLFKSNSPSTTYDIHPRRNHHRNYRTSSNYYESTTRSNSDSISI